MNKSSSSYLSVVPLRDSLMKAYQDAARAFAAVINFGTATQVLTAFRAALVAEVALLRDSKGAVEFAIADAVEHEIAQVDRDLAARTNRQPN